MYRGKLTSHASVASHLLKDLPNAKADSPEEETEVLGTPVVFYDTAGCEYFERVQAEGDGDEGSKCNENEVSVVKAWVDRLVSAGVLPSQIAIITPYQAQVTLLSNLMRPLYGLDIEIGTVDGMQGREKDAVIISLVRSNEKREVGFLKDKRRLNGRSYFAPATTVLNLLGSGYDSCETTSVRCRRFLNGTTWRSLPEEMDGMAGEERRCPLCWIGMKEIQQ